MAWVAVGGALVSAVGGAVSANQGKRAAARARDAQRAARLKMDAILRRRTPVTNPYANSKNLSNLAQDLTSQLNNPFANLGVATQAAEIQMEQADMALANTLDTLRATGASAGGATALAQAALKSKKGVSANIEQQEAANEKARAQGEQQLNQVLHYQKDKECNKTMRLGDNLCSKLMSKELTWILTELLVKRLRLLKILLMLILQPLLAGELYLVRWAI